MAELPPIFVQQTRQLFGDERFERYLQAFSEPAPVSIRLNPQKVDGRQWQVVGAEPVPWCRGGYYLSQRPNFTQDPLLHAGCYYVQEAASMFLDEVLRQQLPIGHCQFSLDMCAAPGGKSTLMRSALPADGVLYSNEPVRQRAAVLAENVSKWGYANHRVTNVYPRDYRASKLRFDVILCDVPCSGEGMFRKDEATIREWSPQQVDKCWRLQREIVDDAWQCLNPGGLLIYSTCTYNIKENEENVRYFLEHYDCQPVAIDVKPEWHICGSLLPGFDVPVYRFIPGISRGEGLFMAVLRKDGTPRHFGQPKLPLWAAQTPTLGSPNPHVELTYTQAISYLRGEALQLPAESPRGLVDVCFMGHVLGPAKNIGLRANNLYPKPWRIKTTHTQTTYSPILIPIT